MSDEPSGETVTLYEAVGGDAGVRRLTACFNRALDETIESEGLRAVIREPVTRLAFHMQNRE